MSENKFLKCTCTQCGGHIEFPADGIGQTVPCPHCNWPTELALDTPDEPSARSPRSLKWLVAGVVILIVGVVGVATALVMAQKFLRKPRVERGMAKTGSRAAKTNAPVATAPTQAKPATLTNDFSVSDVKIIKTAGSTLIYASGTIKNESDKQRFGVTVEIDLFDSADKKIGSTKDYNRDAIEAGGTWTFRALLVQKGAASARVTAIREQQ
jgi:hypothetical protein